MNDVDDILSGVKPYKINIGDTVKVHRCDREYAGRQITFYHVILPFRNREGETKFFEKTVYFKKGQELKDKTIIKINSMYETAYQNRKMAYPQWGLFIGDYEIVDEISMEVENYNNLTSASEPYQNTLDSKLIDSLADF